MKQLTTAFLAILFAGYGTANYDDLLFDPYMTTTPTRSNYLTTTTVYEEGTTTVQTILPVGDDSVPFKEGNDLVERVNRLKKEFFNYERKVTAFVLSVNQVLTSFYFDRADNLVELTNYLPSAEQIISRRKCHCGNTMREPCPQMCINSCYISHRGYEDDCKTSDLPPDYYNYNFYCYDGSAEITRGDISECYDPPTAKPCSEFAVNQTNLKESFLNFAKLLVEPARIKVRGVQRNLKFVRESIRSMDTLSDISYQHCKDPQNMLCFPGATELIETKVKYYEELAKNITKDLIDTQTEIDRIEGNVHILTEGAIKQINDATKNYACCLKGLNFKVDGIDCEGPTTKATLYATLRAPVDQFLCNNGLTTPSYTVCDGVDDCGDNSDEVRCRSKSKFIFN